MVRLVAHGKLILISHRCDGILRLAAAVSKLCQDSLIPALHRIDDLVGRQADLITNLCNAVLNVAQGCLDLLCRTVERRSQLGNSVPVTLYGLHQQFTSRISSQFRRQSVATVTATSAKETTVAVPSENRSNHHQPNDRPPSVLSSKAVAVTHQGKQVGVNASSSSNHAGEQCSDVHFAASAGTIAVKNISSLHNVSFKLNVTRSGIS